MPQSSVRAFCLWLAFLPLAAMAVPDAPSDMPGMRSMRFRSWSVMQGLPQATARDMVQDSTGYLWIATQDGLARFDGYEFHVYKHDRADPLSLSDNYIRALAAAPDGDVWVATRSGGLDRYRAAGDSFSHWRATGHPGSLASNSVTALAVGDAGRLWVAEESGRLQWIDAAGGSGLHNSGLGRREVLANVRHMAVRQNGHVLLASLHGLWDFDPGGGRLRAFGPIREMNAYALLLAADDSVWVGTAGEGLYHLDARGTLLAHYRHDPTDADSLPDDEIRDLLLDRNGVLWIAGNSQGLASLDPRHAGFRHYPHRPADPQSISANRLWSLYQTRRGLLMVGSWTNGFSMHDPATESFRQIYSVPGNPAALPAPPAMSVYGDRDGSLWAGVIEGGGLVHIDLERGVIRRYVHDPDVPDSLSNNFVQYVTRARGGGLWVATVGGGLDRLRADGSGFDHLRHDLADPGSLASDSILYVSEDSRGTLWVATRDSGLDERCAGCTAFRHHRHDPSDPDSIASNIISAVLEDGRGGLWVGTRNAGLDRLDPKTGRFEHFVAGKEGSGHLSSNSISTLFRDREGILWVGTQGGALDMRLPTRDGSVRFRVIDHRDGLDSDAIGGILEDDQGQIWVSTIRGISRINRLSGKAVNYSGHDGASQLGYWVNSATMLADGRLVFGGLNGITVFDPARLHSTPLPAPVITGMLLEGRRYVPGRHHQGVLARGGPLTLRHDQNDVSFEFSALDFSKPESVEYRYRLFGHDRNWVRTGYRRRIATYTGLDPGHYRLEVRVRNGNTAWDDASRSSLLFQIASPPWATPWAWAGYALALMLVSFIVWWRVRRSLGRRRATQALIREREARLKMALWGSGTEMWDIDLTTGQMYRENRLAHIAASEEAESQTMIGYLPFVHPEDLPRFEQALYAHLKQQSDSFEASYRTLDLNHRWVWLLSRGKVVERDATGRALRISGITSDIDALKHAEEALRVLNEDLENRVEQRASQLRTRNEELRATLDKLTATRDKLLEAEKLAALGGLVAGVAHEINTPLGVALTAASYLHDETQGMIRRLTRGELSPEALSRYGRRVDDSADMIMRNLRGASRLVSSFKKVAVAQSSEDMAEVDLAEALEQIMITLGPMLKKSPHQVELTCAAGIRLRTSPGALYQIVTNLITNSLTHAFDHHSSGTIRIRGTRDSQGVRIVYSDDGSGMDDEVLAHIYEPFFTTRRGQGGSGLGLHIVYNLVTQVLSGEIQATSRPGRGTRFTIHLPERPSEGETDSSR